MRAMLLSSAAGGISVIARPARRLVVAIRFSIGNAALLVAKSAASRFDKGAGRGVHSVSFYGRRYGLPQLLWSLAMMNMKEE